MDGPIHYNWNAVQWRQWSRDVGQWDCFCHFDLYPMKVLKREGWGSHNLVLGWGGGGRQPSGVLDGAGYSVKMNASTILFRKLPAGQAGGPGAALGKVLLPRPRHHGMGHSLLPTRMDRAKLCQQKVAPKKWRQIVFYWYNAVSLARPFVVTDTSQLLTVSISS